VVYREACFSERSADCFDRMKDIVLGIEIRMSGGKNRVEEQDENSKRWHADDARPR
jgi:hypothetical protein